MDHHRRIVREKTKNLKKKVLKKTGKGSSGQVETSEVFPTKRSRVDVGGASSYTSKVIITLTGRVCEPRKGSVTVTTSLRVRAGAVRLKVKVDYVFRLSSVRKGATVVLL